MLSKNIIRIPLRSKYALTIIAVAFSIVAVLTYTSFLQFNTTIKQVNQSSANAFEEKYLYQLKQKAQLIVAHLSIILRDPVLNANKDEIFTFIESATKIHEIEYIYVYDKQGKILQSGPKKDAFLLGNILADKIQLHMNHWW